MAAVTTFSGGAAATAQRNAILGRLAKEVPGLVVEGPKHGRPTVWTVTYDGESADLSGSGVELWVAGFRAGRAHATGDVHTGDGARFSSHTF